MIGEELVHIKEFYDGRAVQIGYGGEAWHRKLA